MPAVPIHHTKTSSSGWDGPEQVSNLETPITKAVGDDTFAWVDPDADETTKAAWKFPHHFVTNHVPGAASTSACSAGIAALNGGRGGTTIPDADREGVHAHLAAHLIDSGVKEEDVPELKTSAQLLEERAAGDDCNRCDGEGTIDLGGDTVECPQCGGTGSGSNNATETQSHKPPATAIRGEMRGVPESRISTGPKFELREIPNGTGGTNLRFTGFASVTGDEAAYEMEDWLGPWIESVSVGAFGKTLSEGADVAFLLNHEGMTLARTKPGTLKLAEETNPTRSPVYGVTGLHSEALLDPQNMYVQAMRSAVERGDLDEMSFAFRVLRQEWNEDYTRRWINEVSIDKGDVSLVNYGANPTTGGTVAIRQRFARSAGNDPRAIVAIREMRLWSLFGEWREGKVLSGANEAKLQEALRRLHDTDDADLPGIVRSLQDIDSALDDAQAAVATVLGVTDPDGDPNDLEPALVPPGGDDSRCLFIGTSGTARARLEALRHAPPRSVA
jgi:HK97 family phage prohead protease